MALSATRTGRDGTVRLTPGFYGGAQPIYGQSTTVASGSRVSVAVVTDAAKHQVSLSIDGRSLLAADTQLHGQVYAQPGTTRSDGMPPALTVTNVTDSTPGPSLCRGLIAPG